MDRRILVALLQAHGSNVSLRHQKHRTRRVVVACLATGRRRSELLVLDWSDADLAVGHYLVRCSKTHLSRWYPINGMFHAVLMAIGPNESRAGCLTVGSTRTR